MAKLITGILAHVDAGKTTLSEALLFEAGAIRQIGRVDSKNAFLDNNNIEKERGITIFAKQAVLNENITLIDTPGHVDFSAEMERTLSVLDSAILLINAGDGIQSHTKTLWSLLNQYKIPTVIFVNKMDLPDTNQQVLIEKLRNGLSEKIVAFSEKETESTGYSDSFLEQASSEDDILMEKFLSGTSITQKDISSAISRRNLFPAVFGSALKSQNVSLLLKVIQNYFAVPEYSLLPEDFGCMVYKVSKDRQNNRLTHLKVTGGILKVKENLGEEKVNELRLYSGEKFESLKEIPAGEICTVTGLKNSFPGKTYGKATGPSVSKIEPALIYSVIPPEGTDTPKMLHMLKEIEEELPEIMVEYSEASKEIRVRLMGQIQTEVLQELLEERYKLHVEFGEGKIAYKETITAPVLGIGHYEPLKHYAEVQLKLSPLTRGSGMKFKSELSVDVLDTNWQRLIMTHLKEKPHLGVLTGSPITDIQIEVTAGRAHLKHTEGGDFRQSTYRAIRHGLMNAQSLLLEPVYSYEISVPEENTGRVMSDMEKMKGSCTLQGSSQGFATLTGQVPVSTSQNYINEVRSFTKGQGTLTLTLAGYQSCHNQEEVIASIGYDAEADLENPAGSVFCSHGAGYNVPWQEVFEHRHIKL